MIRVENSFSLNSEYLETQSLLEAVRSTQTLDGGIEIYKNAKINLCQFDPCDLYPTAKYVLLDNLSRIANFYSEFHPFGVDILNLTRIVHLPGIVIGPPIVEISDGVPAIVDGIHRCWFARENGLPITVVLVENSDPEYPLISFPVTWGDVLVYKTAPTDPKLRRDLRPTIEDKSESLRKYYRDLSYLGSTGRRPRSGQNG